MKTLIHKRNNTSICIFNFSKDIIDGSFFKEKPESGDIFMSHSLRDTNFLYVYRIEEVIHNRDGVVCGSCTHDPKNARFQLKVSEITSKVKELEIDNSLHILT